MEIVTTSRFRKDLKRCSKRGKDIDKIEWIVSEFQQLKTLLPNKKDHPFTGNWVGYRECHIEPNWLLIYCIDEDNNILHLVRTGSHSDLFDE